MRVRENALQKEENERVWEWWIRTQWKGKACVYENWDMKGKEVKN